MRQFRMANEHSVSTHLRLDTAEYDRIIRTYIPFYDESRQVQLDLLGDALAAGVVLGARVPIVLTSRADSAETRAA